jgi:hypothetical protein
VAGLLVTSLLPQAPKILLNVETGDSGELARRSCECPLGRVGLDTHRAEIRSFEKLTDEGMTFVGTRVVRVLEEVLPAHFGGQPSDYQLLEIEDAGGLTHLELRADPALGPLDEARVRAVFLAALEDDRRERPMAEIWKQARSYAFAARRRCRRPWGRSCRFTSSASSRPRRAARTPEWRRRPRPPRRQLPIERDPLPQLDDRVDP